jgi:hypothetical protein
MNPTGSVIHQRPDCPDKQHRDSSDHAHVHFVRSVK